jgi:hypothetical protein
MGRSGLHGVMGGNQFYDIGAAARFAFQGFFAV